MVDLCKKLGITLIAYSPLEKGILTGKYSPENLPQGLLAWRYNKTYLTKIEPIITALREIGEAHGGMTPAAVALNWLICKGAVPIPGARNSKQAQDNAGALGWQLSTEEVDRLDKISDRSIPIIIDKPNSLLEETMLRVDKIDTNDKALVKRFVRIPYRLYENHPQWVPPLFMDAETQLNRKKHPYYEHSDADFFIATRDGRDVGRIAALENKHFNEYHKTKQAQFYLFECEDDQEAANALFERAIDWAKGRGLNRIVGPKGFGALDGYGISGRRV